MTRSGNVLTLRKPTSAATAATRRAALTRAQEILDLALLARIAAITAAMKLAVRP